MKRVQQLADLEPALDRSRPVALVPTMGAFHEGHLDLMRRAGREGAQVVVSLFVNPTQFGPGEDFERYPRDLEGDASMAEAAGVDVLFAPDRQTVYPRSVAATVTVPEVTELYEGRHRPGHFDGVATVVLKLFHMVRPNHAHFGLKDRQQCAVIRRMVEDLNVPVGLRFEPTYREADGLAMSSRNRYLRPEERRMAPLLYETLSELRDSLRVGTPPDEAIEKGAQRLRQASFVLDYLDLVDPVRMVPTREVVSGTALIVAARLGSTRLIDNVSL